MEYLLELRRRLLSCLVLIGCIFAILCFYANPLYQILAGPLLQLIPSHNLIATELTTPFLAPMKLAFVVSVLLGIPYFFYHLWSFIAPALYSREKKLLWRLLLPSILLFYMGILFAFFFVLPATFRFFVAITPNNVAFMPEMNHHLSFSLQLLFAFGIAFEVPIVIILLVLLRLVTVQKLRSARRYIIVLAFIVGMFLTPPDVLSQTMLAVPLWLLYELGLWLAARIHQQP